MGNLLNNKANEKLLSYVWAFDHAGVDHLGAFLVIVCDYFPEKKRGGGTQVDCQIG